MATLGSTNITTALAALGEGPVAYGDSGLIMEVFRIPGGAVADTAALTPNWIKDIRSVQFTGAASNNLSSTQANTNVTLTLTASAATNVNFDAWLVGRR